MSILQDYEEFRKAARENGWSLINEFLKKHQKYYLSDLLYNQAVYKTYEKRKTAYYWRFSFYIVALILIIKFSSSIKS